MVLPQIVALNMPPLSRGDTGIKRALPSDALETPRGDCSAWNAGPTHRPPRIVHRFLVPGTAHYPELQKHLENPLRDTRLPHRSHPRLCSKPSSLTLMPYPLFAVSAVAGERVVGPVARHETGHGNAAAEAIARTKCPGSTNHSLDRDNQNGSGKVSSHCFYFDPPHSRKICS